MKKYLLTALLALVFVTGSMAQTFQGTIKYSMKLMGEQAAMMEAYMPTSYKYTVGKTDMLVEMEGGMVAMMMGKILKLNKKDQTYVIKDAEETAYLLTGGEKADEGPKPTVSKEDETVTILGYECQKYKVESEGPAGAMTQYVWATPKIKFPTGGGVSSAMGNSLSIEGIDGIPLKTMMSVMGVTIIMTAEEVSTTPPAKSALKIPKGYKKDEMDINSLMGGMGQ